MQVPSRAWLEATLESIKGSAGYGAWDVGCRITTDGPVRLLNRQYRRIDAPTDILSFGRWVVPSPEAFPAEAASSTESRDLGDLVVSGPYVARHCAAHGLVDDAQRLQHWRVILTHGLCHLLGYDHETDAQFREMEKKEAAILAAISREGDDTRRRKPRTPSSPLRLG